MGYKKINIEGLPNSIEVPADLSDDEALELVNGMLSRGELDDLIKEVAPINTAEKDALNITDYTPQDSYQQEDPFKLAMGISELDKIPIDEAREYVAGFPRRARERLKGNNFAPLATIGDIYSAPGRGISAALFSDEDPLTSMSRIDANPYTQSGEERGFWSMLGEGVLRSPSTLATVPLGGAIGQGVSKALPAFLKTGTRPANVGSKAAQGVGQTATDIAFDESTRPDELGNISGMNLGLSLLGGGALGAAAGGIAKTGRAAVKPKDITGTTPQEVIPQYEQKFLDKTGLTKKEMNILPMRARGVLEDITPDEKSLLDQYTIQAVKSSADRSVETPYEIVGRKWLKGEELLNNARKDAGKVMGEIEDQALKGAGVPSEEIWNSWNKQLNKLGLEIAGEPGETIVRKMEGRQGRSKASIKNLQEITDELNDMGDVVSPASLRDLEQTIADYLNDMPVTRSGKVSKPIDTSTKGLKKDIKELVYKKISENTDESMLESYDQARKNYGKYSSNLDELQRRIGKVLEVDGKETSSRGANLISSMLNQKSNQTTKSLASAIEELDPSLNLVRESMIADLAMNASPSRGGLSFSDLASKNMSKSAVKDEVVGKFISPVLEFFGAKNKDYTPAMLGEIAGDVISRKSGQAPMYNNALDYIPQFTTYGARPAQKEIGEFIFPYTQDEEL